MRWLPRLAIGLGLGLAPGCLATFSAHDAMVEPDTTTASEVAFYLLLPGLLAIDVVTAPFQYVYVITHAR